MGKSTRGVKAYKNQGFLNSREARTIRILTEYMEPEKRLGGMNVLHTVVFFGSSKIRAEGEDKYNMGRYYWIAEEFAYRLAIWGKELEKEGNGFYICTGGGPGIMEAANRGAHRAEASSIGLNISIPHEQIQNRYITPELNFEFHYFFMRKLWFLYHAKALIVFPGGYGTFDELFEALTLIQTRKINKGNIPILLYDKEFWEDVIDFQKLVEYNLISQEDFDLIYFFSDLNDGFNYLKPRLEKIMYIINQEL